MSKKLSTFTRFAKNKRKRIRPSLPRRAGSELLLEAPEVVQSHPSSSPLAEVYESNQFRTEWDNDLPFHVAENVVRLRRFRERSQAQLAARMKTSQSKVARMEGGDANVTLRTLQKIGAALNARVRLVLEPREVSFPSMPPWWEAAEQGLSAGCKWTLSAIASSGTGANRKAAAGWTTHEASAVLSKSASTDAEALLEPSVLEPV